MVRREKMISFKTYALVLYTINSLLTVAATEVSLNSLL